MERRERWFSDGASALRRTLTAMGMEDSLPSGGQFYACPLCLMAYGRDAFEGGVFSEDYVDLWINYKRKNEADPVRMRPHPYEFALYYDI